MGQDFQFNLIYTTFFYLLLLLLFLSSSSSSFFSTSSCSSCSSSSLCSPSLPSCNVLQALHELSFHARVTRSPASSTAICCEGRRVTSFSCLAKVILCPLLLPLVQGVCEARRHAKQRLKEWACLLPAASCWSPGGAAVRAAGACSW